MHDSAWFAGECPCNDFPCKRAVAAQREYEAVEKIRVAVCRVYYMHHKEWPQAAFLDEVIKAVQDPGSVPANRRM